jgi:hypothetical protein
MKLKLKKYIDEETGDLRLVQFEVDHAIEK